jgi:rubrerythrin
VGFYGVRGFAWNVIYMFPHNARREGLLTTMRERQSENLMMLIFIVGVGFGTDRVRVLRYRRNNHLCLKCGYHLRATPDRCPECGTIPVKTN